jgi:GNAT superfamily N-acetyltransferase
LASVELQVREARLTDIDRVIGLIERADSSWTLDRLRDAADVLRQILYLPNGSLIVALDGRMVVGAAVLAVRPSVSAGGLLGAIDLLAVEPGHELEGVIEALLRELIRTARNKGCLSLESELPQDGTAVARWEQVGFSESGPRLRFPLTRAAAALTW